MQDDEVLATARKTSTALLGTLATSVTGGEADGLRSRLPAGYAPSFG